LAANANAANYQIRIGFDPNDFLGPCNNSQVNDAQTHAIGECIGNFFSPVFPNPAGILAPIQGDRLKEKTNALDFFSFEKLTMMGASGFLEKLVNIPILFFGTILEMLSAIIMFLLVFGFKFIFVYLFYVSLGLQTILFYLDNSSGSMESIRKVHITFWIMGLSSIVALSYGVGWIQ
jgi:hypothetical protein